MTPTAVPVLLLAGLAGLLAVALVLVTVRLRRASAAAAQASAELEEMRRTRANLRRDESRYARIVDSAYDGVCSLDSNGIVTFANQRLARLLGYESHELVGRAFTDFVQPYQRARARDTLERRPGTASEVVHIPLKRRDGSTLLALVSAAPLADEAGTHTGVVATIADVSERTRVEERFRLMVERSSDVMALHGADGSIMYVSPSVDTILGYAANELVNRNLFELVHEDDQELMAEVWARLLNSRGSSVVTPEYRFLHKDGSWRYMESVGRNLMDEPGVAGILATSHDVTERRVALDALRNAEQQFRQSQKLEAVGRLAGGIAHDFNNLLTAIQGYTNLLLEDMPVQSPMRPDLEQVARNAERAAALTRQLLAFSRRQMLQPRAVDLNAIVVNMQGMLSRLIGEHIEMKPRLDADLAPVLADAGQVEQVIMNLVVNARDAMPGGGTIEICTRNASINDEEAASYPYMVTAGEYVELIVTDSGSGIPEDILPQIFEPFFTTKDAGKGTGLGLSTVFGVIKQSGGYVWAENNEGGGATMRIYLPRADKPLVEAPAPPAAHEPATGGETVLVVEDEDAVRHLTTRLLRRAGYTVLAAADGGEAITLCAEHGDDIDLVLTDVVMPGLNGREVVDRLRSMRPGLKALYASGYTRDAILDRGVLDSDIDFIEKPFEAAALARKVRQVLDA